MRAPRTLIEPKSSRIQAEINSKSSQIQIEIQIEIQVEILVDNSRILERDPQEILVRILRILGLEFPGVP